MLYLNPPYDFDKVHGRLEQRFLERWTAALLPGDGVLMFLVPFYALAGERRIPRLQLPGHPRLALPGGFLRGLPAMRSGRQETQRPLPENPLDQRRIERWAGDASAMPELRELSEDPVFRVCADRAGLELEEVPLDLPGLLNGFRPWHRAGFAGLNRDRPGHDRRQVPGRPAAPPGPHRPRPLGRNPERQEAQAEPPGTSSDPGQGQLPARFPHGRGALQPGGREGRQHQGPAPQAHPFRPPARHAGVPGAQARSGSLGRNRPCRTSTAPIWSSTMARASGS